MFVEVVSIGVVIGGRWFVVFVEVVCIVVFVAVVCIVVVVVVVCIVVVVAVVCIVVVVGRKFCSASMWENNSRPRDTCS